MAHNGKIKAFNTDGEGFLKDLENKDINLHSKIIARVKDFEGNFSKIETTAGRMILGDILPKNKNIKYDMLNKVLTKKEVSNIIDTVYRFCGQKETVLFADRIMGCLLYTSPSPRD